MCSGNSAISPSKKYLAVSNLHDGLDWYDVGQRRYINTTKYKRQGGQFSTDVRFVEETVAVVGHTSCRMVVASMKRPEFPHFIRYLNIKEG